MTQTDSYAQRNTKLRERYLELESLGTPKAAREMRRIANDLMEVNNRLLWSTVQPFLLGTTEHREDLYAAAAEHLWKVFLKWDPNKATLSVAARAHLSGAVRREVAKTEYSGMSYDLFTKRGHAIKTERNLTKELGREPSQEEVAAASGLPMHTLELVNQPPPTSLDALPLESPGLHQITPGGHTQAEDLTIVLPENCTGTVESLDNLFVYFLRGNHPDIPRVSAATAELLSGIDRRTHEFRITQAKLESALVRVVDFLGEFPDAAALARLAGTSEDAARDFLSTV